MEAVFPDYFDYFDYVYINRFKYDEKGFLDDMEVTPYDFEGKIGAVKKVCKAERIKLTDCVFVGEGPNDLPVVKWLKLAGGMTIGYPADRLADDVEYDLWKDRMDAVLEIIFQRFRKPPQLPLPR